MHLKIVTVLVFSLSLSNISLSQFLDYLLWKFLNKNFLLGQNHNKRSDIPTFSQTFDFILYASNKSSENANHSHFTNASDQSTVNKTLPI